MFGKSDEFCFPTPSLMIAATEKITTLTAFLIYYRLFPDPLISSFSAISFPNVSKGQ